MKTTERSIVHQDADKEPMEQTLIGLQEQFIKQVTDNSLPADQVLIEQNDSVQKEKPAQKNQAPLFIP